MNTFRRVLACSVLLLPFGACGGEQSTWQGRSAREWAEALASPDEKTASGAWTALRAFADESPEAVLEALAEQLEVRWDSSVASSIGFGVDLTSLIRAGMATPSVDDLVKEQVPVLQSRWLALGLPKAMWKVSMDLKIQIVAPGSRSREEIERIQTALAASGTMLLRPVIGDPEERVADGGPPPKPFPGPSFSEWRDKELQRWREADLSATPYRPTDPRFRIWPTRIPPGGDPTPQPVFTEEPTEGLFGIDERAIQSWEARKDILGGPFLVARAPPEHTADVPRTLEANAGQRMAVILDGRVRTTIPTPVLSADRTFSLPLWRARDDAARREADDLVRILSIGRLPFPLTPIPPDPSSDAPMADPPAARLLVTLGDRAIPTLERVEKEGKAAWARDAAKWALAKIREKKSGGGTMPPGGMEAGGMESGTK